MNDVLLMSRSELLAQVAGGSMHLPLMDPTHATAGKVVAVTWFGAGSQHARLGPSCNSMC